MLKDCPKPEKIYSQQIFAIVESLLGIFLFFNTDNFLNNEVENFALKVKNMLKDFRAKKYMILAVADIFYYVFDHSFRFCIFAEIFFNLLKSVYYS